MITILRSLIIFNLSAFWIGIYIDDVESKNFSLSYENILRTFDSFIYPQAFQHSIIWLFILYRLVVFAFIVVKKHINQMVNLFVCFCFGYNIIFCT